jgi:hypothetical protein
MCPVSSGRAFSQKECEYMRLIDADEIKKLPFEKLIHTDFGDTCIPIEEIDYAPTVEALLTNEEVKDFAKENFDIGYEMAKAKFERPHGEWVVTAEDNDGVHRICCPFCSYEKGSNNTDTIIVTFTNFPKFCENCGADMKGGTDNG